MAEQQNIQQLQAQTEEVQEQEIDLIALFKRLWKKRVFIIYVTLGFMVFGLLVALFSPKQYTASAIFVPQTSQQGISSSMSSLAALAGINMGNMNNNESLSPAVYPQLLSNVDFIKELMYTPIKFEEWPDRVTLFDYYTNEDYNKPTFFGSVMKYTVGLPGVIIKAIKGEPEEDSVAVSESGIPVFSAKEYACKRIVEHLITIEINDKDGYVQLSVDMPEPEAAAEVATAAFNLLEKYVTKYKIQKAQATLDFVNERFAEAKAEFEAKQQEYARFKDANRMLTTATSMITQDRLEQEYNLANTIYTELARQKTQVELQVKEDTPVLSVVQPIVVPFEKSKPKRSIILIAFTFLGGCMGCASVFGLDFLKHQGSSWPRRWKTEEEEEMEETQSREEAVA
mgnify:FL=1